MGRHWLLTPEQNSTSLDSRGCLQSDRPGAKSLLHEAAVFSSSGLEY